MPHVSNRETPPRLPVRPVRRRIAVRSRAVLPEQVSVLRLQHLPGHRVPVRRLSHRRHPGDQRLVHSSWPTNRQHHFSGRRHPVLPARRRRGPHPGRRSPQLSHPCRRRDHRRVQSQRPVSREMRRDPRRRRQPGEHRRAEHGQRPAVHVRPPPRCRRGRPGVGALPPRRPRQREPGPDVRPAPAVAGPVAGYGGASRRAGAGAPVPILADAGRGHSPAPLGTAGPPTGT